MAEEHHDSGNYSPWLNLGARPKTMRSHSTRTGNALFLGTRFSQSLAINIIKILQLDF